MSEKVCVGVCAIDLNKPGFVKSLIHLIQQWDETEDTPIIFDLKFRQLLHMAQEAVAMTAISNRCSHLLFIEDDTTSIPDGALRRLLDHNVDVVGAFAYARHFPHYSMIFNKMYPNKDKLWLGKEMPGVSIIDPGYGLKEVDMVPYQFTLIKTSVFEKIKAPWFFYDNRCDRLTDFWFADRCFEAGIKIHCDTDLIVQHDGLDERTVGYSVLKGLEPQYPPSVGPMWNSNMIIPIMQRNGFEVSNEQMDIKRMQEAEERK